jgi:heavy metal translocating P-type ATPase
MIPPADGCALCGLPCDYGVFELDLEDHTARFCCPGCRQVFLMLSEAAGAPDPSRFRHTDLFKRCQAAGIIPRTAGDLPATIRAQQTSSPNVPAPPEKTARAEDHLTIHLAVEGMWCPACAWVIETALARQDGIRQARCNFATDRLRCDYHPARTSPQAVINAVRTLGYVALPMDEAQPHSDRRRLFTRFGITCFLSMNVMMLSFALYSGFFTALDPQSIRYLSWPLVVLTTVVMVYGGWPIHHKALAGIIAARPGMEALISIGALSAYTYSLVHFLTGSIHLYFDTACMLITLVLLGKILERRAKDRILEDLGHYFDLMPAKVRRCTSQFPKGRFARLEQLQAGDDFIVHPEEVIPADGLVVEGRGAVDEASLTGEARPVGKRAGERVQSGTRVLKGRLRVRTERVGPDSTLGLMIAIMEAALGSKTEIEGRTDRILRAFVPGVVALAAATAAVLIAGGHTLDGAFVRALTVLVISCPCALGIAIPLARVAAVSLAARRGILIQDFKVFDRAERIDTVVLDKTGTLTAGAWQLLAVEPLADRTPVEVLALAAGMEQAADHPIAAEIRRAAAARKIAPLPVQALRQAENGVAGKWRHYTLRLGAVAFMPPSIDWPAAAKTDPPTGTDAPLVSYVYLAADDQLTGRLVFGDRMKDSAPAAIRALEARRQTTRLVSGDGEATTLAVARALGIPKARGDQSPAQKADIITRLQARGHCVAMVGDGINDAPALAAADVGVAVFAGRHLGREAQAVTLMRGDPYQLIDFLEFAGRVRRKILQNLVGSFIYNLVSIPVAMAGWLSPLVAVGAMLLSSLSVTGNILLMMRTENRRGDRSRP